MTTSSPYQTIAVASTFSPRFVEVLSEAKRIRDRFSAELHLIYAGEETPQTAGRFREILTRLSLPPDSTIHYEEGDPADSILRALASNPIDLIVAGALEKKVVFHPFLGNVARRLVREARCSVMLFIKPDIEPKPMRKIVFVADDSYSEHGRATLRMVFDLAAAEGSERLYVIRVVTTFDKARASRAESSGHEKSKTPEEEEAELEQFVLSAGATDVPVEARCIRGNTGFAAADFVQSVEADLLAVAAPLGQKEEDLALPANIAWLTDVIPCNLWVIR